MWKEARLQRGAPAVCRRIKLARATRRERQRCARIAIIDASERGREQCGGVVTCSCVRVAKVDHEAIARKTGQVI